VLDQRSDGGFEAAQILRPRLAMVAILDERDLDTAIPIRSPGT
jgi:hypothetical protein